MIISLDIETYGAFKKFDHNGQDCPDQTVFNPHLSASVDGVRIPPRMVPQCAITLVNGKWDNPSGWEPGSTAVFDMSGTDVALVAQLMRKADAIVGSNIAFDIMYLMQFASIRDAIETKLSGNSILVDTIILSWIHSGARKERSLKALGPALGAFAYDRTIKDGKFPFPMSANAVKYNAEDTHNAVIAAKVLAQRTWEENHVDVNADVLRFHSDRLWNIVYMSLQGQIFKESVLNSYADECKTHADICEDTLNRAGILLFGEGSGTTQHALLDRCVEQASSYFIDLLDSGLLEYSDKKRAIRSNRENRNVLIAILKDQDPTSTDAFLLENLNKFTELTSHEHDARKLIADRIWRGGEAPPVNSGCFGEDGMRLCYPSWYGAPTDDGGARSLRLSCRRPAAQTWHKELRQMMVPPTGFTQWHVDMSAFELRIAALLSKDKDAIEYASRSVVYTYADLKEVNPAAKVAMLVGINGGTADKAWRTAIATTATLISKEQVKRLPVWHWPRFREWQQETFRLGLGDELLIPGTGIKYQHNPTRTIHDTVSFMIQGTAAVFMSRLQHQMLNRGHSIALQLHDELVIDTTHHEKKVREDMDRSVKQVSYSMFMQCPFTYVLRRYHSGSEAGVHDPR